MLLNRLNKSFFLFTCMLGSLFILSSCSKKNRLSASTYEFSVTPPATSVVKNESVTLIAKGQLNGQDINVTPTWTVSSSAVGTLSSSIGPTVTFQANQLGDAVVTATYDGLTTTVQIAVVAYKPVSSFFNVYTDDGLPSEAGISSDIFTICPSNFLSEVSTGYTPEGTKYQRATNLVTGDFWGITLDKATSPGVGCAPGPTAGLSKNLSSLSTLKFTMRLNRTLSVGEQIRINVSDRTPQTVSFILVSGSNGFNRLSTDWQEISLPIGASYPGLVKTSINVPFALVAGLLNTPLTVDIDGIRWEL
ncbi:MAG: Ig-like domain-containing protein [Elusimicrobiota bacterium]